MEVGLDGEQPTKTVDVRVMPKANKITSVRMWMVPNWRRHGVRAFSGMLGQSSFGRVTFTASAPLRIWQEGGPD